MLPADRQTDRRTSGAASTPVPPAPHWACPLIFAQSLALCRIWGPIGECPVLGLRWTLPRPCRLLGALVSLIPPMDRPLQLCSEVTTVFLRPHRFRVSSLTVLVLGRPLFLGLPAPGSALGCAGAQDQAGTQATRTRGVRGQQAPSRAPSGHMGTRRLGRERGKWC